jgi:phosphosulfolactate phosphohydrolase-like enzyme
LLTKRDLREDVAFCLRQNVFNLVAELGRDGVLRAARK